MALVNNASPSNGHRSTPRFTSRTVIAASAATSLIFAAAAPAAAAPAIGSLDSGSLQQGAAEDKNQQGASGSLGGLLPEGAEAAEGAASLDAETGGAATGSGAGEGGTQSDATTPPSSTVSPPSGNAYDKPWGEGHRPHQKNSCHGSFLRLPLRVSAQAVGEQRCAQTLHRRAES